MQRKHPSDRRRQSGQAMIELVAALVAIIVLFVAIIQLGRFAVVEQTVQSTARRRAGELALSPIINLATPDHIATWDAGPDGRALTRDDLFTAGSDGDLRQTIAESGVASPAQWPILDQSRDHDLLRVRTAPAPVTALGLVDARASEIVELLPGVRNLLYRADAIEIESIVWMSTTRNIY